MACFFPLNAYKTIDKSITFNPRHSNIIEALKLPCGRCIGCRLERSRQWAIRCVHEASLHEKNCFITLTYAPEHLPANRSLDIRHFQLFMKRLRKKFGSGIRFYHCGEYGAKEGRPHYHAILFGFDFPDRKLWKIKNGIRWDTSEILADIWGKGFVIVGECTFESAAYVARYIMKKVNGDGAAEHYEWVDPETGEVHNRKPEYTTMSRRSGIGGDWFAKFSGDVFPHDRVVIRGRSMRPPKYYDGLYEVLDPVGFEDVKFERYKKSKMGLDNNTPDRLEVRHEVQRLALERLPRPLI